MSQPKFKSGSDPVCWWCGISISITTTYRGEAPDMPDAVGVVVCTPACPERPEGLKVYEHPDWRK